MKTRGKADTMQAKDKKGLNSGEERICMNSLFLLEWMEKWTEKSQRLPKVQVKISPFYRREEYWMLQQLEIVWIYQMKINTRRCTNETEQKNLQRNQFTEYSLSVCHLEQLKCDLDEIDYLCVGCHPMRHGPSSSFRARESLMLPSWPLVLIVTRKSWRIFYFYLLEKNTTTFFLKCF